MNNRKRNVLMSVFVGIICLLSWSTQVLAATTQTVQVDATSYVVSTQWFPVGDEAGHTVGIQQREGEAVFDTGETAKYYTVSTFDSRRGQAGGTSQGYSRFTFADESVIMFSWRAEIGRTPEGLSTNQGQGTIIKGTGRFQGITGESVFSGGQLKPAAEDTKLTAGQKATITYMLP